jgi:hypothetical protein
MYPTGNKLLELFPDNALLRGSVINKSVSQSSAMADDWLADLPNFAYTL